MIIITKIVSFELWGLREGLLLAKDKGLRRVIFELDSESVVTAMRGEEAVNGCSLTLFKDCRFLTACFEETAFQHILREGNKCVEHLANVGQTGEWGTTILDSPPINLVTFLAADAFGVSSIRVW